MYDTDPECEPRRLQGHYAADPRNSGGSSGLSRNNPVDKGRSRVGIGGQLHEQDAISLSLSDERRNFPMLKRSITYTDYNGGTRTEDFYFNLQDRRIRRRE